jgi:hypothetical protein
MMLDGEIAVPDERGVTHIDQLSEALRQRRPDEVFRCRQRSVSWAVRAGRGRKLKLQVLSRRVPKSSRHRKTRFRTEVVVNEGERRPAGVYERSA